MKDIQMDFNMDQASERRAREDDQRKQKLHRLRSSMKKTRKYIDFENLATWVNIDGEILPRNDRVQQLYLSLLLAIRDEEFLVNGRSRVWCLCPYAGSIWRRIGWTDFEALPTDSDRLKLISYCWVPTELARGWARKRKLDYPEHLLVKSTDFKRENSANITPNSNNNAQILKNPVSRSEFDKWYNSRIEEFRTEARHPSSDQDLLDAREAFPHHKVTRELVRETRRKLAPESWQLRGRRKFAPKS